MLDFTNYPWQKILNERVNLALWTQFLSIVVWREQFTLKIFLTKELVFLFWMASDCSVNRLKIFGGKRALF